MLDRRPVQDFIQGAQKRSLTARQDVMRAGDDPESIFLLLSGSVSVMKPGQDGREIVLAYLEPGDFFGEMCLFPDQQARTALVRTRSTVLLAEMSYRQFRHFAEAHPEIMFCLAEQLALRLNATSLRLTDLAFVDVAGRMARALLGMITRTGVGIGTARTVIHDPTGKGVTLRVSRQELARVVGCSREMAGRVLKRLEDEGIIVCRGRSILVDVVRLKTRIDTPTPAGTGNADHDGAEAAPVASAGGKRSAAAALAN